MRKREERKEMASPLKVSFVSTAARWSSFWNYSWPRLDWFKMKCRQEYYYWCVNTTAAKVENFLQYSWQPLSQKNRYVDTEPRSVGRLHQHNCIAFYRSSSFSKIYFRYLALNCLHRARAYAYFDYNLLKTTEYYISWEDDEVNAVHSTADL